MSNASGLTSAAFTILAAVIGLVTGAICGYIIGRGEGG